MRWQKQGLVFVPDGRHPWNRSHAQVPVADVRGDVIRIYYGTRDASGRTLTSFLEVDADNPSKILSIHDRPVMELGVPGCFDDSGVMPASILHDGDLTYLYYSGWNRSVDVSYRLAIGRAVSRDGGTTFEREFAGPICDRSPSEPITVSQPWVLRRANTWRMWYLSFTRWESVLGKLEPCYHIKTVASDDGLNWKFPGTVAIDYDAMSDAIAVPCVWGSDASGYEMMYCYRKSQDYRTSPDSSYRLGYAVSPDGVTWERRDDEVGIDRSPSGWDSEMIAYPNVVTAAGRTYLFYNGNGFGRSGFGYAVRTH
jgi:hypothetical protein